MKKHPDVEAYWNDIRPKLDNLINTQRNKQVENCIGHAFALYSFVMEHFSDEATRHQDILARTGIMLVHIQDVMRGLISAQAELSPSTVAALLRISFEVRCNLNFIIKSSDPQKYADRYARYLHVERFLRDEYRPPGKSAMLSPEECERIRNDCSEWFTKKGKVIKHWTAQEEYKSLSALAEAIGLQDDYSEIYAMGSKFVHGSSLLVNLYSKGG